MSKYLQGVAQLTKQLQQLGAAFTVPVLRSAVRAGIQPAKKQAIAMAPAGSVAHRTYKGRLVAPGFGKRSIRVVTKVNADKTTVSAALGVRREAFYMVNFVERGTSKMPAQPWLRPAMKSTQSEQEAAFAAQLIKRIDKVLSK